MCVCLSPCPSVCLSVCLCVSVFVCLSCVHLGVLASDGVCKLRLASVVKDPLSMEMLQLANHA